VLSSSVIVEGSSSSSQAEKSMMIIIIAIVVPVVVILVVVSICVYKKYNSKNLSRIEDNSMVEMIGNSFDSNMNSKQIKIRKSGDVLVEESSQIKIIESSVNKNL